MPLYIFRCDKCVLEIEKIQGINGGSPNCPKCGGAMYKKPSPPATIIIKDGGYLIRSKGYKEDYGKEYRRSLGEDT